ncbi:YdcF family protein [Roseomonas sp. CCTCC AB2023176]|uniref:YdcF family protein n=1 Tax=Roseomonas sp. CCTCC AB2023176 TaxID=3342640 RepID=UPI0035DE8A36
MRDGDVPLRTAVVIFGAAVRPDGTPSETMRRRVIAAAQAAMGLVAPLYLPTGGLGRNGPTEATLMRRLLEEAGVDPADILEEPTGTDTLSSAFAVAALLRARGGVGRVLAVSSGYHLRRCVMLLRLAGVPAEGGAAAQPGPGFAEWRWRLREAPALPYDAVAGAWRRWREQ